MPRGEKVKLFLRGLVKFLALVLVAGGIGVGLGIGLSKLAQDDTPAATATTGGTVAGVAAAPTTAVPAPASAPPPTATAPATTTSPATSTSPSPSTSTSTSSSPPPSPAGQIRISILDARLFTDSTPSGNQEQRARVTARVRAENPGTKRVTLDEPILRVGSVRIAPDPGADAATARFAPLAAGAAQTVTLRFAVEGEATPKLVRDRRARILIAGRSLAMRLKVRAPTG